MNGPLLPVLYAGAAVVVVAALAVLAYLLLEARTARRLTDRVHGGDAPHEDSFRDVEANPLLQVAARRGREIEKFVDKSGGETRQLLAQAGWRHGDARVLFYALQAVAPLLLVALVVLGHVTHLGLLRTPFNFFIGLAFAVIAGLLLPRVVLRRAAQARRDRVRAEVPLLVNLLVMLFEAGLTTRQALASLVRDGDQVLPELQGDFEIVVRQLEAGGDSNEVLQAYGSMIDVPDLNGILGILRQIDRFGGEIRAPLLEALEVIEERRGLDLRERVNLISGRMTVVMVLFFFPALLIFLAAPAFISIIRVLGNVSK